MTNKFIKNFHFTFASLMLLDVITTTYALNTGIGYEGNSHMVSIVTNIPLFIAVKAVGTLIVFALLYWIDSQRQDIGTITKYVLIVIALGVVLNNIYQIRFDCYCAWRCVK